MEQSAKGLWSRDFSLVVAGQLISLFGNAILRFALPLYILDISKSAALFGTVSALSFLPMVVMSPLGGIIADRVHKQRIMVALDFATSILVLLYIAASGHVPAVPLIVAALMAMYAIQGMYVPAVQSSVPALVRAERLVAANAVVNLVNSFSGMTGPVVGGILYGVFGLPPILYTACACFALSSVMEMFIRIPYVKRALPGSVFQMVKSDMSQSFDCVVREKSVLAKSGLIIFFFNVALTSMLIIGLPILITQYLDMGSRLYGMTQGVTAAGGLAGGLLGGILGKRLAIQKAHIVLLAGSLSIVPIGLALLMGISNFAAYVVITGACPVAMAVSTLFSIQMLAFIQSQTPQEIIGKVMSFIIAVSLCAHPIGQMLFGRLFERFFTSPWVVVFGSVVISCAIALYSRLHFGHVKLELNNLASNTNVTISPNAIPEKT